MNVQGVSGFHWCMSFRYISKGIILRWFVGTLNDLANWQRCCKMRYYFWKKIFKSYQTVLMAQCCGSFRIGKSFQEWTFMQVYESWIIFCPQMYVVEGQKKILHSVENMPIIDHAWTMAVATRQMSTVLDLFCPSFLATMATEAWRG